MWKQRLQQLGHRRNNNKRANHIDVATRPRSNTALPPEEPSQSNKDIPVPPRSTDTSSPPGLRRRMTAGDTSPHSPNKAHLKAWWHHFLFTQRPNKKDVEEEKKAIPPPSIVFGKPLKESLKYASVQISTANANGELYVWGHIPVVVAKCGLYLKETATEIQGVFRVNGSNKRMRELQAAFESPPRFGKNMDWKNEHFTAHDVASVFRRYLTQMPEPVIPHDMYFKFRDALATKLYDQDEVITAYKCLIRSLPRANQYLLLYVLDLLSVFARKSDKNLMTAKNLAVIFRPALLSYPAHELSPQEHQLSQDVLEFLIAHQDWFMLDIPPPPSPTSPVNSKSGAPAPAVGGLSEQMDTVPSSDDEQPGNWRVENISKDATGGRKLMRRRNTTGRPGESGKPKVAGAGDLTPVVEDLPPRSEGLSGATVTRSQTLPSKSRPTDSGMTEAQARLLKKHKRTSALSKSSSNPNPTIPTPP